MNFLVLQVETTKQTEATVTDEHTYPSRDAKGFMGASYKGAEVAGAEYTEFIRYISRSFDAIFVFSNSDGVTSWSSKPCYVVDERTGLTKLEADKLGGGSDVTTYKNES